MKAAAKKRLVVYGIAILFLMMTASQPLFAQSAGETLFNGKCKVCHGADGNGDTLMGKKLGAHDLRSAEVQKQTDAQLTEAIKKGKDKMKGFDGKITDAEIKSLVVYIRELGKKK
jgi:mono/diheme cytochrome c family protein